MAPPVVEGKKGGKGRVKWVKHYSSSQSILIIGDGDLSFSQALATAFGSGENIVATSLDSYSTIFFPFFTFSLTARSYIW